MRIVREDPLVRHSRSSMGLDVRRCEYGAGLLLFSQDGKIEGGKGKKYQKVDFCMAFVVRQEGTVVKFINE
jgi:hypothetical protein